MVGQWKRRISLLSQKLLHDLLTINFQNLVFEANWLRLSVSINHLNIIAMSIEAFDYFWIMNLSFNNLVFVDIRAIFELIFLNISYPLLQILSILNSQLLVQSLWNSLLSDFLIHLLHQLESSLWLLATDWRRIILLIDVYNFDILMLNSISDHMVCSFDLLFLRNSYEALIGSLSWGLPS